MQMLVHIRLLYFVKIMKLFISIVFGLNMFLKKLKSLSGTEQQKEVLLYFFLTTGIIKKLLSVTRNKKKNDDKILMLAKSKLNNIETLEYHKH